MNPLIGQAVVIAVITVLTIICGRNVLRDIKAELKGEETCAGCSGSCHGGSKCGNASGCGSTSMECMACMKRMEELKKLSETKQK